MWGKRIALKLNVRRIMYSLYVQWRANGRWVFCVAMLCCSVFVHVCCIVHCIQLCTVFICACHIFLFLHVNQQNVPVWYLASDRFVSKLLLISFPHPSLPAAIMLGGISWCVRTGGDEGARGDICKTAESVKIRSVYLSWQSDKVNVMVSNKCYDNFEYISVMNLQSTA